MMTKEILTSMIESRLRTEIEDPESQVLVATVAGVLNDSELVANMANGSYDGFAENFDLGDARNAFGVAFICGMSHAFASVLAEGLRRKQ